jgi:hypothetical protein
MHKIWSKTEKTMKTFSFLALALALSSSNALATAPSKVEILPCYGQGFLTNYYVIYQNGDQFEFVDSWARLRRFKSKDEALLAAHMDCRLRERFL